MKGDFTRTTFEPEKHYRSVRMQQGRVQLDADWNEQSDITVHRIETETIDTIGECGGSIHHGGFRIVSDKAELTPEEQASLLEDIATLTLDQGDFLITPGRYYVDGILCESESTVRYSEQPDLPLPPKDPAQSLISHDGFHVVYLHVWQRHITKLEDPDIREVALGGPDSATRVKTVWQVRHMPVGVLTDDLKDCSPFGTVWIPPEDPSVTGKTRGRLRAQAEPPATDDNLCVVPPEAGYQRLENQLYRVEIHDASDAADGPTFKWSRENGTIVARLEDIKANVLTVSDPGKDEVLGFGPSQWVELSDERHVLHGQPGSLVKLKQVQGKELTVDSWPDGNALTMADFGKLPAVRRWDMPKTATGAIEVDTASPDYQDLEGGVQVKFEGEEFRTGDYWTIPARTVLTELGDILWPSENDQPAAEEPHGIEHHFCPLALVKFDSTGPSPITTVVHDCRNKFPPLTEQLRFFYIGGTGQEAMPGKKLGQPLQVGVSNGQWPVAGAKVEFETVPDDDGDNGGSVSTLPPNGDAGPSVMAQTDSSGIAACEWQLDANPDHHSQRVMATLLTPTETSVDGLPSLAFDANLSIASQVAYNPAKCSNLSGITDVQEAIDKLCQLKYGGCCISVGKEGEYERLDEAIKDLLERGQRDICICLLPGEYVLPGLEVVEQFEDPDLRIKLIGCGLGSRLILKERMLFAGVKAATLRDVAIEFGFVVESKTYGLAFQQCSEVTVSSCHLAGVTDGGALLSIGTADRIRLSDNIFEAASIRSLEVPRKVFEKTGVDFLGGLFGLPEQGHLSLRVFQNGAIESADALAALSLRTRKRRQTKLKEAVDDPECEKLLSKGEFFGFKKFSLALGAGEADPQALFESLADVRRAAIKSRPGNAIVLARKPRFGIPEDVEVDVPDEDRHAIVADNEIIGVLSLYGLPAAPEVIAQSMTNEFLKQLAHRLTEGQITIAGLLGTLQLRGNQLVGIMVAEQALKELVELEGERPLSGVFGRCLFSENVIEGISWIVSQHLAMATNDFTIQAKTVLGQSELPGCGIVIADSTVYVGNHGRRPGVSLRDVSRVSERAANLEMSIMSIT